MRTHEIRTIHDDGMYCGWPTIARHPETGRLFVAFSGHRKNHVCPFGQVLLITSDDEGATWSAPRVIANGPIDDRDAGVCFTAKGTVLVNWFTSVAYAHSDWARTQYPAEAEAVTERHLIDELGCWCRRSTDHGETFEDGRIATIANSPHGPCLLAEGRLLYIGKLIDTPEDRLKTRSAGFSQRFGCAISDDDGKSWSLLCEGLPVAPGQSGKSYHEYHAVQCPSGRIVAQIRNHNEPGAGTWQMESESGGRDWTEPHRVCAGFPSHLLRLRDGRLLMSYSHRLEPFGNFARISPDEGTTWSEPFVFGPVRQADMGYPSTAELADGTFISVWYAQVPNEPRAVLRAARWAW